MSNGWFVRVDTAFIIVIVRLAQSLRQAGWSANRETWPLSELTHQNGMAYLWKYTVLEGGFTNYSNQQGVRNNTEQWLNIYESGLAMYVANPLCLDCRIASYTL